MRQAADELVAASARKSTQLRAADCAKVGKEIGHRSVAAFMGPACKHFHSSCGPNKQTDIGGGIKERRVSQLSACHL